MKRKFLLWCSILLLGITGCSANAPEQNGAMTEQVESVDSIQDIPEYSGEAYVVLENNEPSFSEEEMQTKSFEEYSELDDLGRCGAATANVGKDLMPTEKRGAIGKVKPSGWQTAKYDCVDGKYLYNRCHLIGYQLTAENANEKNLITGTRYMNVEGMLPFENMVADYVKETNNHVLYRVTPILEEDNLVASGVQMEAKSVEDDGEGVSFNVFCYNVQPGVEIDYETGKSKYVGGEDIVDSGKDSGKKAQTYVLNVNTNKFHLPECKSLQDMKKENQKKIKGEKKELLKKGYEPCQRCKP